MVKALTNDVPLVLLDSDLSPAELDGVDESLVNQSIPLSVKRLPSMGEVIEALVHSTSEITMFTSGTTGQPKKVVHSIQTLTRSVRRGEKYNNQIWAYAYNPTHMAGLQVFFQAFENLNTLINVFNRTRSEIFNLIKKHSITHISATPTFYRLLLPYERAYSSVIRLTLGGEKSDGHLYNVIRQIFPSAQINNVYASTEAGSLFAAKGENFQIPASIHDMFQVVDDELLIHRSLLGQSDSFRFDGDYYHSGDFPELSPELRKIVINRSAVQEQGIRINHIPIRGGHLFWSEDISVLLDQYQDIREQQEELTARNRLLQKTYQKEAERRKTEEQNRLLNMIQNQTAGQLELLSQLMDELERTESREHYDRILGKIVVVGTYLKRRKNLVLTQYASDGNLLTMEDLRQSLAESCDSLKLCKIRAAYYVENGEVQLKADDILKCYDTFEWLVERLFDTMQSVFYRVSQIDDALRISVHIVAEADLRGLMSERPELNVQQEDENEWFIGCIVFRKRGGR